jgi:hypothetical protein
MVLADWSIGQVLLWDITAALHAVAKKRNRGQRAASSTQNDEEEDDKVWYKRTTVESAKAHTLVRSQVIPPVLPEAVSNIDSSHKRPVAEVLWLPPNVQVSPRLWHCREGGRS